PISQTAKKAMVRPDFTSQLGTFVIHQLKKMADAGDIPWGEYDVDFLESGLPKVGMSLVGDVDGGAPVKSMSYDMDTQIGKAAAWSKVIAEYAAYRPFLEDREVAILGWGGALCGPQGDNQAHEVTQAAPALAQASAGTEAANRRTGLLSDAVEDDPGIPSGAGVITGPVPSEDGDDQRCRAILDALAESDEPLVRSRLDKAIGASRSTTHRVLQILMDDGLVIREDNGPQTTYRLADDARVA